MKFLTVALFALALCAPTSVASAAGFQRDLILRIHGRWFRLPGDQFDALHYGGMSVFKIGILLFNLTPLVVLCLAG
jgi:hypothetical protein